MLIFLLVVGGNTLVLLVVLSNKHMQTTTNLYLVNMAAADILMCLGNYCRMNSILTKYFSVPSLDSSVNIHWSLGLRGDSLQTLSIQSGILHSTCFVISFFLAVYFGLYVHIHTYGHCHGQVRFVINSYLIYCYILYWYALNWHM